MFITFTIGLLVGAYLTYTRPKIGQAVHNIVERLKEFRRSK